MGRRMSSFLRFSVSSLSLLPVVLGAACLAACGAQGGSSADSSGAEAPPEQTSPSPSTSSPTGDPQRAIAEADIIQLDTTRLYAMSKSGTLSVVDVSTPAHLAMLGQITLPGQPFEMYRRGDVLLAMANGARSAYGTTVQPSTTT